MTTTILEKNLQRLINDYDEETKKAGKLLKKFSKTSKSKNEVTEEQLSLALEKICTTAKPTSQIVLALIKAVKSNR